MTYNSTRHISFSISMLVHILVFILLLFIKFTIDYPPRDYVELSFGKSNQQGSSGAIGTEIKQVEENAKAKTNETVDKSKEVKVVNLPKAKNTSEENVIKPADKQKEKTKEIKTETDEKTDLKVTTLGDDNKMSVSESSPYDFESWGGQGKRAIYSRVDATYPEGVQKVIDIRLRFSILPDGTVGTVLPLTKADTKLENTAINSLRQWRFAPLAPDQKQVEQKNVVIIVHFRLKE